VLAKECCEKYVATYEKRIQKVTKRSMATLELAYLPLYFIIQIVPNSYVT
jgi:hypothetical protein